MQTPVESEAKSHALVLVHDANRPGKPKSGRAFRLVLPLIYAGMGVALGTLTGVGIAFSTVPASATGAVRHSIPAVSAIQKPEVASQTKDAAEQSEGRPSLIRVAAQTNRPQSASRAEVAAQSSAASQAERKEDQALSERGKKTNEEKAPESSISSPPARQRKHVAHPLDVPGREVLASMAETEPEVLNTEQLSADTDAAASDFYSEGDMTVANYDAAGGTIVTSDGRVFVVGQTVSMSNATSWEDYRSSVHYRCGEGGNCTLIRDGAIAPNARLVQAI